VDVITPLLFYLPNERLAVYKPQTSRKKLLSFINRKTAFCIMYGGAERDRTDDLLLARQALSQLSYSPIQIQPAKGLEALGPQITSHVL
jgi:hypothetical protein